jgi:hypothetical protein
MSSIMASTDGCDPMIRKNGWPYFVEKSQESGVYRYRYRPLYVH